ncbi:MAG: hypothetical protein JWQ44_1791 [Chthoniobacter sp.]|nr:hypothetical protein [Chthoniobacter sp.]
MTPTREGSLRIFRIAGINVFVHWSWLLVAYYVIDQRRGAYSSLAWNIGEYLALFVLVLMHEYGHALACRQVGGRAEEIVLWPLGGVAYVAPPHRPGAVLWSIAAGPLVNAVLYVVFTGATIALGNTDWPLLNPNAADLLRMLSYINGALLLFNLLPVYPLDGGQILQALLWFRLGYVRSLKIATMIGFIGVAALAAYAYHEGSIWLGILAVFVFLNCRQGFLRARALSAEPPRR